MKSQIIVLKNLISYQCTILSVINGHVLIKTEALPIY